MPGVERLPVGILLTGASVVAAWRLRHAWLARHVVVSRRDRILTTAAPAGAVCCALTAVLGLLVIVHALTGAGAALVGVVVVVLAVAVVAAVVVYGVVAWRVLRSPTTSPGPAAPPAPSGLPAPTGPPPGWVPPTPQAAALLEARRSGDVDAICAALTAEPLLWLVRTDTAGGLTPLGERRDGRLHLDVLDRGVRTDPRALRVAAPGRSRLVLPGRGADPPARRRRASPRRPRSTWPRCGPGRRPIPTAPSATTVCSRSHRSAPTAHSCTAWPAPPTTRCSRATRGTGSAPAASTGRTPAPACSARWGFESARDWQQALDNLAEPFPSGGDTVFALRRRLGEGALVPADAVAEVVEADVNVERNGREVTDGVLAELRQVEAYEGYLREAGVLAAWEQVHTLLAWDLGRGAMLARWGLDADFCDEPTARWQVERFGTLVRRYFDSWPEFGASFVLGRALWSAVQYDEYGDVMMMDLDDTVRPFTILMDDPTSPWRTVPFHPSAAAPTTGQTRSDTGGR